MKPMKRRAKCSRPSNPKIPAVIDLYASYQVSKNLFLRLSVQNAMNKDYFGSAEPSEFDAVAVERQYADEHGAGKDVCGGAGVPVLI